MDLLKRCLCFAQQNPENLFFSEDDCHPTFKLIFVYEQWLVITASCEGLAVVAFVSYKFMSSCVICLVIAREVFLLQSDCSAITNVHKFFTIVLTL